MDAPDLQKILENLEPSKTPPIRHAVAEVRAADIAQALTDLEDEAVLLVFSLLGDVKAAEVLAEADENTQEELLESLGPERLARLLNAMDPDDAADLVELAPEEGRVAILAGLDDETRRAVRMLSEYEPESAGGIMTTEVVAVGSNETVHSVLGKMRDAEQPEAMSNAFVVDPAGTLVGFADLKSLLSADPSDTVDGIMNPDVISIQVDADQEEAARLVEHYDLASVPVVDAADRLKGVITLDDIIEVLDEEASEDMLRLAGTGVTHPTTEPVMRRLVARAPWLSVTLVGTFFAGLIIEYVERTWFPNVLEAISHNAARFQTLLYFIPLIGGMAGNVGSQSSTIMVRGFATGEVDPTRPMRVLRGEVTLALIIGVLSGLTVGMATHLLYPADPYLGVIVGVALPCAILVAALAGTLIPFACHAVRVDPAYAGGPFLLTMNDIAAYLIYFAVAINLQDLLGGA
ncbi:MAG: magnesium transporter [Planctomycetota bacterium]|jgi:magnesium transporter|nr:magnesium transporter [Planctomycetota bacterium]